MQPPAGNPGCSDTCFPAVGRDILSALRKSSLPEIPEVRNVRNRWIPRGVLLEELSRDTVLHLLQRLPRQDNVNIPLGEIADYVAPRTGKCSLCNQNSCTAARLILVGLIEVSREAEIYTFYRSKQCDSRSGPAYFVQPEAQDSQDHTQPGVPEANASKPIHQCPSNWGVREIEYFRHCQWWMRTHYLRELEPEKITTETLEDGVSLPWVAAAQVRAADEGDKGLKSRHSSVMKVKIHQDHHNLGGAGEWFVLKIISEISPLAVRNSFGAEVGAYQKLQQHERVLTLLQSFKHRGDLCMLFPYAENGTLKNLWESFDLKSDPTDTPEDAFSKRPEWCSSTWLLQECLGLADGLAFIHGHDSNGSRTGLLHVDIKPENILAFSALNPDGPPKLRIADFGYSRHLDSDGGIKMSSITHTMTYRPPEKDLRNEKATVTWDVWCLGCVYLEFVIWFLLGFQKLQPFETERISEKDDKSVSNRGKSEEDAFFRKNAILPWIPTRPKWIPAKKWITAKVKRCVTKKIRELETNLNCDDNLKQLLKYVETRMLVVSATKRAGADETREFLRGLT